MRWEQGVRLSGPPHYLSDGVNASAAYLSGWGEQLTWMTEWRRVMAGCPPRHRCWVSCGHCHRCCPRYAPGRPPWTPALTWFARSPPLWSYVERMTVKSQSAPAAQYRLLVYVLMTKRTKCLGLNWLMLISAPLLFSECKGARTQTNVSAWGKKEKRPEVLQASLGMLYMSV